MAVILLLLAFLLGCGGVAEAPQSVVRSHSVQLEWMASPDALGYRVYRASPPSGVYELLSPVLVAPSSYTDLTTNDGKTYSYVVTAVDALGAESSPSNEAIAVVPQD